MYIASFMPMCEAQQLIHLIKTAAQNEDARSYHSVRGVYFLTVIFVISIIRAMFSNPSNPSQCACFIITIQ